MSLTGDVLISMGFPIPLEESNYRVMHMVVPPNFQGCQAARFRTDGVGGLR